MDYIKCTTKNLTAFFKLCTALFSVLPGLMTIRAVVENCQVDYTLSAKLCIYFKLVLQLRMAINYTILQLNINFGVSCSNTSHKAPSTHWMAINHFLEGLIVS